MVRGVSGDGREGGRLYSGGRSGQPAVATNKVKS